jgi:hypothetical protein
LIYGAQVDDCFVKKFLMDNKSKLPNDLKCLNDDDLEEALENYGSECREMVTKILEIDAYGPYECDPFFGASWNEVGDNETGLQFKTRIEEKLKAAFGPEVRCSTHSETWYS